MFRLDGKTAIVTGAARGVGRAAATALNSQGARLALADIRFGEVKKVAAACGPGNRAYRTDVSKPVELTKLVADVRRDFGRIDILVNNAAMVEKPMTTGAGAARRIVALARRKGLVPDP